jgi:hypothetical protein
MNESHKNTCCSDYCRLPYGFAGVSATTGERKKQGKGILAVGGHGRKNKSGR